MFLTNALQHNTTTTGCRFPAPQQPGFAEAALLNLDDPPERRAAGAAAVLGPGAGRALGGELDFLMEREGEGGGGEEEEQQQLCCDQ